MAICVSAKAIGSRGARTTAASPELNGAPGQGGLRGCKDGEDDGSGIPFSLHPEEQAPVVPAWRCLLVCPGHSCRISMIERNGCSVMRLPGA
jgi:hypothetical protein